MKKFGLVFIGMITGVMLVFGSLWIGSLRRAQADSGVPIGGQQSAAPFKMDASGALQPQQASGSDEEPPEGLAAGGAVPAVLPTAIPGESLVYFVTADSDATATVIYLYNTDAVQKTVALRGYSSTGVLGYSLNIIVPATGFVRLSSDSIVAGSPPSWATPAPVITNFTDFTFFASLSLPKGVKVEGYVLFNPGTGTVDPRLDQGAIPIRFSTDPATVFLPSVQSSP